MFSSLISLALPLALAFAAPAPIPAPDGTQDLAARAACSDVAVVFARGTFEAAPIGTVVGPPFKAAIQSALPGQSVSFQGVDYPADVQGFLAGGDKQGSQTMAQDVQAAAAQCPNSKIVMAGYSQGAQLVHNAASQLPASVASRVNAVVMFGDPDNGTALGNGLDANTKVFCANGDLICAHQDVILPPHLSYGANAGDGAAFIASKLN